MTNSVTTQAPSDPTLAGLDPEALTVAAVLIIVIVGVVALGFMIKTYIDARRVVRSLSEILDGVNRDTLRGQRQLMLNSARSSGKPVVQALWREFDESLVESPDGRSLWNSIDADHFFNVSSVARTLVENRIFMAAPAILTALGVLGTFIGLAIGLGGLEIDSSASSEDGIDQLTAGIQGLIASASFAFFSSVVGVSASIVVNLVEKSLELSVRGRIQQLQHRIDALFPRQTPEQSLVRIMSASEQAEESLLHLHERIGSQLEKSVQGISEQLQVALIGAIEKAMEPAMSRAIDQTTEQSTQVLGQLIERFGEHFSRLGETQAQKLDEASASVRAAVDSMAEGVASQRAQMVEQSDSFRADLAQLAELIATQRKDVEVVMERLLSTISSAADRMDNAGENLGKAAGELSASADTMTVASAALGDQFKTSLDKMSELTQQQESAASLFWEYVDKIGVLQTALSESAEKLSSASLAADAGLTGMGDRLQTFLTALSGELNKTTIGVSESFTKFSEAMQSQLDEFATESERQLTTRMDDWNKHSRDYAEHMLKISQALAETLDEMSANKDVAA